MNGIKVDVPPSSSLSVSKVLFDFNGTLALDGKLSPHIRKRISELSRIVEVHVATADTHQSAREELHDLPIQLHIVQTGLDKLAILRKLGARETVAIGNGNNDEAMFEAAALSLAIISTEGLSVRALMRAQLVLSSIDDAFDLLMNPARMKAGLRN